MPRAPFDFAHVLGYLGRSSLEPLDIVAEGAYRRAVRLADRPALVEVTSVGTVDAPALAVRVLAGDGQAVVGADLHVLATGEAARWVRADEDPSELALIAAADPVFGALLARLRGARSPVMPSPFEALIWAILGQQINLSFAYRLKRALVERYGERLEYDGRTYYLFPAPDVLAEADPTELRRLQFSRQKSEYVRSLAALAAAGSIAWEALRALPSDEAVAELSRLRGVGRWTAEYVCLRGLGHRDVIPAADVGLKVAIGRAYGLGRQATEAEIRGLAERWAGWRGHAAYCWWYSLALDRAAAAP
ncbi:MAG: DNA-3-methyladenine glycosylase [Chloroflexota bacterium]|nr:DNA-3-methyladenine glycosylase [Chloroflexota bacterium]